jgi:hypothetical protein
LISVHTFLYFILPFCIVSFSIQFDHVFHCHLICLNHYPFCCINNLFFITLVLCCILTNVHTFSCVLLSPYFISLSSFQWDLMVHAVFNTFLFLLSSQFYAILLTVYFVLSKIMVWFIIEYILIIFYDFLSPRQRSCEGI